MNGRRMMRRMMESGREQPATEKVECLENEVTRHEPRGKAQIRK